MSNKVGKAAFLIFLIVASVLTLGPILYNTLRLHEAESSFQGKPLKFWLNYMDQHDAFVRLEREDHSDAIQILSKAVEIRSNVIADIYRRVWPKMPGWIQTRWSRPVDAAKVRKIAASVLGGLGSVEFRIKLLKSHPDLDVRLSAAASLCNDAWDEKAVEALGTALTDKKDPEVRIVIVEHGFGYDGYVPDITVPALIESLSDGNAEVRTNAAIILIRGLQGPQCTSTVSNAYRDFPLQKKVALERLSKAHKSEDPAVHDAAARWLWTIDGQRPDYIKDWWN